LLIPQIEFTCIEIDYQVVLAIYLLFVGINFDETSATHC
jgi:hypothetical protein